MKLFYQSHILQLLFYYIVQMYFNLKKVVQKKPQKIKRLLKTTHQLIMDHIIILLSFQAKHNKVIHKLLVNILISYTYQINQNQLFLTFFHNLIAYFMVLNHDDIFLINEDIINPILFEQNNDELHLNFYYIII